MRKISMIATLLTLLILPIIVFAAWKNNPEISVTPLKTLIDQPLNISISNLPPHAQITVTASLKDSYSNSWLSSAVFEASDKGIVDIAAQAPISGSYHGIDPMGLFWSMLPIDKKAPHYFLDDNNLKITLTVFIKNKMVLQKEIERFLASPDVEKKQIREQGLAGTLFYPKNKKNLPGIIVVPGSAGGISETNSALLASHGYTVFALGYFAVDGLPKNLENIDLEYFQKAIRWFKQQPQVKQNRIAMMGDSRGGELVLLIASLFPAELNAVVAYVPSSVINGGVPYSNKPAWRYKNSPILPFMHGLTSDQISLTESEDLLNAVKEGKIPFHKNTFEDPYEVTALFLARIKKYHSMLETAAIPVENIRCPLLILTGENDKIWPSSLYGEFIMERLDKKGSHIERKNLHFPNAGHEILFPYIPSIDQAGYHPVAKFWYSFGGTAEGNAHASKKAWEEVLKFFDKTLTKN